MRRTNWQHHAAEVSGPSSRGFDHLDAPLHEREAHSPAHSLGDHDEGDRLNWWSDWIDLGGEG